MVLSLLQVPPGLAGTAGKGGKEVGGRNKERKGKGKGRKETGKREDSDMGGKESM